MNRVLDGYITINNHKQHFLVKYDNNDRKCNFCGKFFTGKRYIFVREGCSLEFFKELLFIQKYNKFYESIAPCCPNCFNLLREEGLSVFAFKLNLGLL